MCLAYAGKHSNERFKGFKGGIKENAKLLMKINKTVENLVSAKVNQQSNGTEYVWDLIPPVVRLILLNQVDFRSKWNVIERLSSKATKLEWSSVPADLQKLLLDQKASLSFLDLTFLKWGFVNSPAEQFANTTLLSLMPMDLQILLPTIKKTVDLISFDSIVNATIVKKGKHSDVLSDMMRQFNDHHIIRFRRSNSREKHGNRGSRYQPPPPPPNPFDVINRALMNAAFVVANAGLSFRFF